MAAGVGSIWKWNQAACTVGPNRPSLWIIPLEEQYAWRLAFCVKLYSLSVRIWKKNYLKKPSVQLEEDCRSCVWNIRKWRSFLEGFGRNSGKPADRTKPWGTGHAVICAREFLTEPFAVINADDYYGKEAYVKVHDYLVQEQPADDVLHICMAGFRLGNTLSDNGSVTRGLCHITDGKLTGVTETHNIFKTADGAESREDGQPAEKLDLNELVSMNMWGLTPAFMDTLYDGFVEFLQNVKAGDIKAEYLLPVMIDALIQKGTAQVDVLETKDTWFGVTYQEDKEVVIKAFKELTEAGVYPNGLYK